MKVALCFRGKCESICKDQKASGSDLIFKNYNVSFQKNFQNFIEFVNFNKDVDFDIYGHGWIDNNNIKVNIINNLKKLGTIVDIKLENQIDFYNNYKDIPNGLEILQLAKGYAIKKNQHIDINFANFFQSQFSYAYSISKVSELLSNYIKNGKKYDLIINVRWDLYIKPDIRLNELDMDYIYVNYEKGYSPVFFGDFILITKKNILFNFIYHIYENYKNPEKLNLWAENMYKLKQYYRNGRFTNDNRMSIWANQCLWAYYLYTNEIPINKLKHIDVGFIKKISI
jgi:hypothetical protein